MCVHLLRAHTDSPASLPLQNPRNPYFPQTYLMTEKKPACTAFAGTHFHRLSFSCSSACMCTSSTSELVIKRTLTFSIGAVEVLLTAPASMCSFLGFPSNTMLLFLQVMMPWAFCQSPERAPAMSRLTSAGRLCKNAKGSCRDWCMIGAPACCAANKIGCCLAAPCKATCRLQPLLLCKGLTTGISSPRLGLSRTTTVRRLLLLNTCYYY